MSVTQDGVWLHFDLGAPLRVLSWSLTNPGLVTSNAMVWREVKNSDLTPDLDVNDWYGRALDEKGWGAAVAFLTSRDISTWVEAKAAVEGVTAHAVATVGLSNGERVGARVDYSSRDWNGSWGTINVGLKVSEGLSEAGLIELLAIAVQARTAAVIDAGVLLPTGRATGTGTDCIGVAAPEGPTNYAGLHTALGEAAGRAVYQAVLQGAKEWRQAYPKAPGIAQEELGWT
ncbi:MAG TPA: adenosylcobinamide amidohydrolase [Rhodobacteraceae bacterium]|jgi:adenosylcobinamide amidohydrolase|nr:adenosylcobinamide amidohydrolase [Paracoccaceae bacterium]HBV56382.1 adenosylcobinamide amidohydrolase [Paracoccaceae bacterium]